MPGPPAASVPYHAVERAGHSNIFLIGVGLYLVARCSLPASAGHRNTGDSRNTPPKIAAYRNTAWYALYNLIHPNCGPWLGASLKPMLPPYTLTSASKTFSTRSP